MWLTASSRWLALVLTLSVSAATAQLFKTGKITGQDKEKFARAGRVFSLFSVVQFKNDPCTTSSALSGGSTAFRNGTCYTSSECATQGGSIQGTCAAGFGVCCLFSTSTCGTTVTHNATYLRNPGFPNQVTSSSLTCAYTINKESPDVCALRLDFENFMIMGSAVTNEYQGGSCVDTFVVTGNSQGTNVPVICGANSGQHMYVDIATSNSATLTFNLLSAGVGKQWEIKVLQIPCSSPLRPPDGCLQYFTGVTGRFASFNFDSASTTSTHLPSQRYNACIRQEAGYCCNLYSVCPDPFAWSFDSSGITTPGIDSICTSSDFIYIDGGADQCNKVPFVNVNRFCGSTLTTALTTVAGGVNAMVCDCSAPFNIGFVTNTLPDLAAGANNTARSRGVCLNWQQVPC